MTLLQLRYVIATDEEKSMRKAAKRLYVSQPRLSVAIRELEEETGITIFQRVHNGVVTTSEGKEFIAYARKVIEEYAGLELRYINKGRKRESFSVSMQHYMFAVDAYIRLISEYAEDEYHFTINETKTNEVIEDVRNFRSEIGVISMSDYSRGMLSGLLEDCGIEFYELFRSSTHVYLSRNHPLAGRSQISLSELQDYPYLSFDQGDKTSYFFREEALASYDHRKLISSNDRASSADIIIGCSGYTLGVGVLRGIVADGLVSVKLKEQEEVILGYIVRAGQKMSDAGKRYIEILRQLIDEMNLDNS